MAPLARGARIFYKYNPYYILITYISKDPRRTAQHHFKIAKLKLEGGLSPHRKSRSAAGCSRNPKNLACLLLFPKMTSIFGIKNFEENSSKPSEIFHFSFFIFHFLVPALRNSSCPRDYFLGFFMFA